MAGEDFASMLQERPGAYIFLGNGDGRRLHHPEDDFNDESIRYGSSFWVKFVERSLYAQDAATCGGVLGRQRRGHFSRRSEPPPSIPVWYESLSIWYWPIRRHASMLFDQTGGQSTWLR